MTGILIIDFWHIFSWIKWILLLEVYKIGIDLLYMSVEPIFPIQADKHYLRDI